MVKTNKPATSVDDAYAQLVEALGSQYEQVMASVINDLPNLQNSASKQDMLDWVHKY
jgi:hypothetical protein